METMEVDHVAADYDMPAAAEKSITEYCRKPVFDFFKRIFDILASLIGVIILSPVFLIVSILIFAEDKGNPIYCQTRIGKNGKPFKMYKFRSMKIGADKLEEMLSAEQIREYKKEFKLKDDPRLIGYRKSGDSKSCFGAIIRKTSIDEIPQILFNVLLRGDMSLIGPRPLLKEELEKNYTDDEQILFTSVKPGLTGYWQAYARNDATYESGIRQKMELHYIRKRSVWMDVRILFKTVSSVIRKSGAK